MKLETGMYIRTDKGFMAKIEEFKYHYTKGKRLVDGYSVKEVTENYLSLDGNQCRLIESIDYSIPPRYPSDEELDKIKRHIVKVSHNIIDLIEVGDYVNGHLVKATYLDGVTKYIKLDNAYENNDGVRTYSEDIKLVVTKEQFENISYRIGE